MAKKKKLTKSERKEARLRKGKQWLRCAVENDVFASLPQDLLLDELELE